MKKALCALLLLVAADAAAAVSYRLDGSSGMVGRVLADGPRIRIDFDNGTVMLTSDGGKTLTILDPAAKTYTAMTAADFTVPGLNVSNPKSTARDLGDGGALEGFPTRKWQVDTSFDATIEQTMNVHIAMRTESWRTERLPEAAASLAMGQSARTGIPAIDKLLEMMSPPNVKGFTLKEVTTVSSTPKGGQEMTATWTVAAHEIRTGVAAPPAQFAIPAGYKKR
jgi:hypothetical protein